MTGAQAPLKISDRNDQAENTRTPTELTSLGKKNPPNFGKSGLEFKGKRRRQP